MKKTKEGNKYKSIVESLNLLAILCLAKDLRSARYKKLVL